MTVLGYCIGGALATCFAALHPEVTRNLVLLTAPLDFSDAGQFGRMTARGVFPIDQLTDTFPTVPGQMPDIGTKLLNPMASYVGTYRQLWEKLGDPSLRRPRLAGDVPLGERQRPVRRRRRSASGSSSSTRTTGWRGTCSRWTAGRFASADIRCPVLNIAASRDQIAPRPTTSVVTKRVGSKDASEIIIEGGHVGIVVGRSASQNLWPKVGAWLSAHD